MVSKKTTKSAKSDKGRKQHSSESVSNEEKQEDHAPETPLELEDKAAAENDQADQENQETPISATPAESDRFSDEPTLTELIVESFEGERERGYFEGYGIAVFTNGNIYEGNFTEGMMHGKGKYIWTENNTVYEGDFYHNQITGKGIYCWPDGSSFEGDVLNGIRHGTGTFRHPSGLSYSGQWDMGRRLGEGRLEYDFNGASFYEGEWKDNVRHGFGCRQYPSGNIYEGMWYNGIRHGQGTMRWLDRDEMYTGQWEDGVQHGMGQHVWFVRRIRGSQYPLRNIYDGEFVHGQRHGFGEFYYPNGARYEGEWKDNLKSGQGKFVFKNGRIYEGEFECDRIKEYPHLLMDGRDTPDLTDIRTRSPAPFEVANSVHSKDSYNTISPSFQLYINHILSLLPDHYDQEEETTMVTGALLRHYGCLRRVYNYYSELGNMESQDNTFAMNQMQFWRFMKDCKFHHHSGLSLTEIDRFLAVASNQTSQYEIHNPTKRILFLEFINHVVNLSYLIYKEEFQIDSTWTSSQECLPNTPTETAFGGGGGEAEISGGTNQGNEAQNIEAKTAPIGAQREASLTKCKNSLQQSEEDLKDMLETYLAETKKLDTQAEVEVTDGRMSGGAPTRSRQYPRSPGARRGVSRRRMSNSEEKRKRYKK